MDRRHLLVWAGAALATVSAGSSRAAPARYGEADYARGVVIDAQAGLGGGGRPLSSELIEAIRTSGVTALSMTVGRTGPEPGQFMESVAEVARMTQLIADNPEQLLAIRKASDLALAKRTRRLGIIYNFQDTTPLESDLAHVETFKALGVRILQLTYNKRNLAADGALEPADAGLSNFGRQLVAEINRQRVLLDLSHGGRRTIAEAIAASTVPPAITHTGCRDLVDLPRNVFDSELKALADKGGVVGIYLMPFLRAQGQPTGEDVIRHIEHALIVCGEDHVGIGTDGGLRGVTIDAAAYAGQRAFYQRRVARGVAAPGEAADVLNLVPQYNSPRRYFDIGRDLAARGHSTVRIEKILGGNFARLLSEVWGD